MIKKVIVLLIVSISFSLFGMDWLRTYEEGIKEGTKQKKPVLFLYISPKQKESLELSHVISQGHLDCLEDKFIMVQMNVAKPENSERLKSLKVKQIPLFILQDFDPKRKLTVKMQFIQPPQIFNALFDIYSTIGNQFMNLGDTYGARDAFYLISSFPNEMGAQADNAVKQIDKLSKKNKTGHKKDAKSENAQAYFDKALISIKNRNFNKAYLYLEKVKEIAPKSKIAKKANLEQEKISDKVDKSTFLKKKDMKGSK